MKRIIFGLLALGSLLFAACSNKSEGKEGTNDVTITETANQIVVKQTVIEMGLTFVTAYEWNFEDNVCTTAYIKTTYPTESLARSIYDDFVSDEEIDPKDRERYSLNGRMLIYDDSEAYSSASKDAIRKAAKLLKEQLENSDNYLDE